MEYENFIKKMLSEKVFICAKCEKLLVPPIMIFEGVGNVCHSCSEEGQNGVPNTKMDLILKSLKFPCTFEAQGCTEVLLYDNLKEHEKDCIYRPVQCLLSNDNCYWTGQITQLFEHFTGKHPSHVLISPQEEFSFDMNLASTSVIKVLKYKHKTRILRIKRVEEGESLLHFIQEAKSGSGDSEMVAKYVGKSGQLEIPLKSLRFDADCEEHGGKKIRLSTLREIGESSNSVKVVIKPKKCEFMNLTPEVLKQLECPVCMELMRPPIAVCNSGHNLCNSCRRKLTQCPMCRQGWAFNIRNFALENLTTSVQYTCTFKNFGCAGRFLGAEIDKHEAICEYKSHDCPMAGCKFTGNYLLCKNHFTENHKHYLIDGPAYQSTFTPLASNLYPSISTNTGYFFGHNNIYKWIFVRDAFNCSWCLQILNTYDQSIAKYFFKVTVVHPSSPQLQVVKWNYCTSKNDSVSDAKNLVSFRNENLAEYKNQTNGEISYFFEIAEQRLA